MAVIKTSMYGGECELTFESLTHRYTLNGAKVPSVTAVISETEPKPALLYWSANCASDYWKEAIKPNVGYDEVQLETFWREAKRAHTTKKDDAASVGSVTHRYVESFIKGENPDLPINEIARGAGERFMSWVTEHKVKFLSAEQMVLSRTKGYCGQADFFCVVDGKLWLGDLKTSNAIYSSYFEQCSAYIQARNEEFPSESFAGFIIVRVGKEDGELEVKHITNTAPYMDVFNKRVELYKSLQVIKTLK